MHRVSIITSHLSPEAQASAAAAGVSGLAPAKKPVKVAVSGAAGNIGYAILFMIADGTMLGPNTPIELRLLEVPQAQKALEGTVMELQDCAYPLVTSIIGTTDYKVAFQDVDIVLLIGALPRGPGMERKDLLKANAGIFVGQGQALDKYASRNVKVLVVGNPANTNALVAATNAPSLSKTCFAAMTRLDENRALAQLAERLKVPVRNIKNVAIWGNHSSTQYPDVNSAVVTTKAIDNTPVRDAIKDDKWLNGEFITLVQQRGAAIIKARSKSSAASAASAAVDCIRDWVNGTAPGRFTSMAVWSDGNSYGVAPGLFYSFPVTCANGQFTIVDGIKIDDFSRAKMNATQQELQEEKRDALSQ